ncbi:MAG TPA: hypothetical protein PLZ79_07695 [Burkholderiales bacterium]|nr:hypothetical protein [Burkholderiales bacterium]
MIPGRTCPLHYRYSPALFREVPVEHASTVYAIGGLYGNPEALTAVLEMKREEEQFLPPVTLVFNGDFNWFNVDAESFRAINESVLSHSATLGNVEAELQGDSGAGCGCAYPDWVGDATVARSNQIMGRLRETAAAFPDLLRRLSSLPKVRTFEVGGMRIGMLHGDPESLAGWGFAREALAPELDGGDVPSPAQEAHVARWFREGGVRVYLSSHTCLPVMKMLRVDGEHRLVANNGAAGMPNFRGARCGLITRVSTAPAPPGRALCGSRVGSLHVDALPLHYNHTHWVERFLANWPQGSPAHRGYHDRIDTGTELAPEPAKMLSACTAPTHRS